MGDPRRIRGWPLFGAVLLAPALSWTIFGIGSLLSSPVSPSVGGAFGALPGFIGMAGLVTFWGAAPTAAFGAAMLLALNLMPGRWTRSTAAHVAAGALAAGLYCGVGIAFAHHMASAALLIAPWAGLAVYEGTPSLPGVVASIVLAGAAAGWLYHWQAQRG